MSKKKFPQIVFTIFVISIGIIPIASRDDDYHLIINGVQRSAICLVQMIAQENHLVVFYNFTEKHRINETLYFTCELHLKNENYTASATSKKKSKEKVAATAYNQTSFAKPKNITDRTCKISIHIRSDLSVLYEYATFLNTTLAISERQTAVSPAKFEVTIGLDGKSASATGHKKSTIKQTAATELIEALNRGNVINALVRRYNAPKYQQMNSVDRLNKIIGTSGEGPAVYTVQEQPDNNNGRRYKVNVLAENAEAFGFGNTLDEANEDGAKQILKMLDFIVL